jgi:hypothetical protein
MHIAHHDELCILRQGQAFDCGICGIDVFEIAHGK